MPPTNPVRVSDPDAANETRKLPRALPPGFFDPQQPLVVARAPGRLDVMGGISDYSGGLCLEWPLECATYCAIQRTPGNLIEVHSADGQRSGFTERVQIQAHTLSPANLPATAEKRWARYVLGVFVILMRDAGLAPATGARIFISSTVPLGAGLASSAALEVAAMTAIAAAYGAELDGLQIARLCQRVENEIVGAPCGIMDQVTSALGRKGEFLRLLCQPDQLEGYEPLPEGLELYGIDSGVKHSVGGSAYGTARCGAFMGRRILQELVPGALRGPDGNQYLANLSTDVWRSLRTMVPGKMTGSEFLREYGGHGDHATTVDPEQEYHVRMATEHPIYETYRVRRFAELLPAVETNPAVRRQLLMTIGDLMYQSHYSYDHRCRLGSEETDMLVRLAREHGPDAGIYGAKITGGGAGGTVAILADRQANPAVADVVSSIAARYKVKSGQTPTIWSGSSEGSHLHPVLHFAAGEWCHLAE